MCVCVDRFRHLDVGIALEAREQLREVVGSLTPLVWVLGIELRYPGLHSRHPQSHLAGPESEFLDVSVPMNYTIIL